MKDSIATSRELDKVLWTIRRQHNSINLGICEKNEFFANTQLGFIKNILYIFFMFGNVGVHSLRKINNICSGWKKLSM